MKKNLSLISAIVAPILAFIAVAIMVETRDSNTSNGSKEDNFSQEETTNSFGLYAKAYSAIREMGPIEDNDADREEKEYSSSGNYPSGDRDEYEEEIPFESPESYEFDDERSQETGGIFPEVGKYEAIINDRTKIIIDVQENNNQRFSGVVYYPSAVKKYGKNDNTMMPFSGLQGWDDDGIDVIIKMVVKSNSDKSYSEKWTLAAQDGFGGVITTSTGQNWDVRFLEDD